VTRDDPGRRLPDEPRFRFLAGLAQELRQPLTPLGNALRLARFDDQRDYALELATRQLRRLSRLVDDLLDVARLEQGTLEIRRESVELHRVIEGAVGSARPGIEQRGHRLIVTLPDEPVRVDADPARLEQVMANLLDNATRNTPAGGHIEVDVDRIGEDVRLRVRGDFTPAEDVSAHAGGGSDIGLTLVHRLVELQGGRVEVESAGAGRGTEFRVWLPASSGRSLHILLVDDNRDLIDGLTVLLASGGHHVEVAYDGVAGMEAARRSPPDVALVDLGLPRMNGFELARQLRQDPTVARTVLIALSGFGRDEDLEEATRAGFDQHLIKPVDIEAIEALLARVEPLQIGRGVSRRPPLRAGVTPPAASRKRPAGDGR
jgi:CheY-like chemotaxis protein